MVFWPTVLLTRPTVLLSSRTILYITVLIILLLLYMMLTSSILLLSVHSVLSCLVWHGMGLVSMGRM